MSTEDEMNIDERRKYLRTMQKRYCQATFRERGELLDEMEAVTSLHRKSLIRLMNGDLTRKPRSKQRGSIYGSEVDDVLRVIAESSDYICAERLQPNLVWMAKHLARHGEITLSDRLLEQLGCISIATVGRVLKRIRQDERRLPRKGPERANQITRDVPMRRIPWDEEEAGHFEVDLVHHCGPSAAGEYMCTIQMIDVATGWSERIAVLGRSYLVMEAAFRHILTRLPFPVIEIHPDNGSEFFNHHLMRFWKDAVRDVEFSRSRPFQKNDNRFVEQKNFSLVRAYLGHERLDSVAQVLAANALYDQMWLYYNLFQPVLHTTEKILVPSDGPSSCRPVPSADSGQALWPGTGASSTTRMKRRRDQAQTPFDRLCVTQAISPQRREELARLRDQTNFRRLRLEIYDDLDYIFTLPGADAGGSQDVYEIPCAWPQDRLAALSQPSVWGQ